MKFAILFLLHLILFMFLFTLYLSEGVEYHIQVSKAGGVVAGESSMMIIMKGDTSVVWNLVHQIQNWQFISFNIKPK